MFGFRPDGRRLKGLDPILQMSPYIMPKRVDAQVWTPQDVDYDKMAAYIQDQRSKGRNISFMSIIIAGYVRVVATYPDINRFVVNKQIFARKDIVVSFMVLKRNADIGVEAAAVKIIFEPNETLFEVSEKVEQAIEENRKPPVEGINLTEQIARFLLSIPVLPTVIIGFLKFLDRFGLMPSIIYKASPFHTGLFVTNMGSLGMNNVYHHIYDFGTTSIFTSMGRIKRVPHITSKGEVQAKRILPMATVVDERIGNGACYARVLSLWKHLAENPHLLETPPDEIHYERRIAHEWEKKKA